MTLIAQLSVNGVPFLVGDVLLSSDHKTGLQVNLPLAGNINETIANRGLTFEVVGFEQKLNLLGGGRLAVGWCGPVDQAERAMRVLERVAARDRIETADIAAEIDAIDQTRINELQLVVLLLRSVQGSTINAGQYCLGPPRVATRLGPVFATGSGRNDFLRIVDSGEWDFGNEFQMAHGVLGTLVNEELRTGRTIASRWGGGFEAVTFSREAGCFQKVGDILHTFWKFDANAPQSVECIPMFYKTAYVRDALIIRSARLVKTSPGIFDMTENNLKDCSTLAKECWRV